MRRHGRLLAVTLWTALATLPLGANAATNSTTAGDVSVTPTTGESWLNHLHRSFGDTSMGKTGRLGPPPTTDGDVPVVSDLGPTPAASGKVTLQGADLYRLNCQSCHGASGEGAPPEINSVINPVRATSVPLVIERMKKMGMDVRPSDAAELARQSQAALLQRLHAGGESMPSFSQLSDAETRALIAYLKKLAGVRGVSQVSVTESPARVGELIVKSTCHTCHDATGQNPTPQQLENGAIPPLQALPARVDELQLIRKVTNGAPVLMGTPATQHRGRMPVFYYLSRDEAADVYLYLTAYPPAQQKKTMVAVASASPQSNAGGGSMPGPRNLPPASGAGGSSGNNAVPGGVPDWLVTLLFVGFGAMAVGLALAVLGFAAYEMHRLGTVGEARQQRSSPVGSAEHKAGGLVMR